MCLYYLYLILINLDFRHVACLLVPVRTQQHTADIGQGTDNDGGDYANHGTDFPRDTQTDDHHQIEYAEQYDHSCKSLSLEPEPHNGVEFPCDGKRYPLGDACNHHSTDNKLDQMPYPKIPALDIVHQDIQTDSAYRQQSNDSA